MGTIHLPPYHSVLAFAVTNDCAADLELALTDLEQAHSVQRITFYLPNDGTTKRFEVALSDFTEMNVGLRAEAEEKTGTIQVAEMYALSDRQDEDELIHIVKRTPNTVELEVDELPGYRILTLVDAAYPGWRATVDEKPTPLLRANDVFKAVVLPARPALRQIRVHIVARLRGPGGFITHLCRAMRRRDCARSHQAPPRTGRPAPLLVVLSELS